MIEQHIKAITGALGHVSGHRRPSLIWADWMDVVAETLRMLPTHAQSIATSGHPADDDDEARACWERMRANGYSTEDFSHFARAYASLIESVEEPDGSIDYYDILGRLYMDWVGGNENAGQYFTPWEICRTMAMVSCSDMESQIRDRIVSAVGEETISMLGLNPELPYTLQYIAETFLPHHIDAFRPITVSDPCCGSGSMLLAVASIVPHWANDMGLVQYYGQDIDHTACQMSRINLWLRGLNGYGPRLRSAMAGMSMLDPVADMEEEILEPTITIEAGITDLFGEVV
jgi:hypothetical protein